MIQLETPGKETATLADWRSAALRVSTAWDEWRVARGAERDRAHARYVEALADEEIAAARLEHHTNLARRP